MENEVFTLLACPGPLMAFRQVDTEVNKVTAGRGEDKGGGWLAGILGEPADPFAYRDAAHLELI